MCRPKGSKDKIKRTRKTKEQLQQVEDRYFITLPKNMVERKKWTKGKDLCFTWNERGNIEIHD